MIITYTLNFSKNHFRYFRHYFPGTTRVCWEHCPVGAAITPGLSLQQLLGEDDANPILQWTRMLCLTRPTSVLPRTT
jgi:hypothetical protein